MPAGIIALAVLVISVVVFLDGSDLMVGDVVVLQRSDEIAGVRVGFRNEGVAQRGVTYSVVFSADQIIGLANDFVVYSAEIEIDRNSEVTVEIGSPTDIQNYVDTNSVKIPPGDYYLGVFIDPNDNVSERSEINNEQANSDMFFFCGSNAVEVFEVDIRYRGRHRLDASNPFKIYIGAITQSLGLGDAGLFEVTTEGRHFFPLDDISFRDTDGSGYFMMIVHDLGNSLQNPYNIDPGDVAGLYKEVADNVVYGGFCLAAGTPIFTGEHYSFNFCLPRLPEPDMYEIDDIEPLGTLLDYEKDLPASQYHTFHDRGIGDKDGDWLRVYLKAGDSLTVETFSAEGQWESATAIVTLRSCAGMFPT